MPPPPHIKPENVLKVRLDYLAIAIFGSSRKLSSLQHLDQIELFTDNIRCIEG